MKVSKNHKSILALPIDQCNEVWVYFGQREGSSPKSHPPPGYGPDSYNHSCQNQITIFIAIVASYSYLTCRICYMLV